MIRFLKIFITSCFLRKLLMIVEHFLICGLIICISISTSLSLCPLFLPLTGIYPLLPDQKKLVFKFQIHFQSFSLVFENSAQKSSDSKNIYIFMQNSQICHVSSLWFLSLISYLKHFFPLHNNINYIFIYIYTHIYSVMPTFHDCRANSVTAWDAATVYRVPTLVSNPFTVGLPSGCRKRGLAACTRRTFCNTLIHSSNILGESAVRQYVCFSVVNQNGIRKRQKRKLQILE